MRPPSFHVIARALARSGEEDRVRKEFEALVAPTRAEPGCLRYELLVSRENPGEFLFVQEYEDESAFEAHLASKHISGMLKVVLPLLAKPPDIRRYRLLATP
jgi:quinol monooxygenase YgiN